jgi:DNA topoisomerase VI subunit A
MFQAMNAKSEAEFVLVVEKDAIFQKLLDEEALDRLGPCILITVFILLCVCVALVNKLKC